MIQRLTITLWAISLVTADRVRDRLRRDDGDGGGNGLMTAGLIVAGLVVLGIVIIAVKSAVDSSVGNITDPNGGGGGDD